MKEKTQAKLFEFILTIQLFFKTKTIQLFHESLDSCKNVGLSWTGKQIKII